MGAQQTEPNPTFPSLPPQPGQRRPPWYVRAWVLPTATFVVGLLLGVGIGVASGGGSASVDEARSVTSVSATPEPTESTSPAQAPEPVVQLTKKDIELSLKTTERQCFGSAGCNVSVQVRAGVNRALADALPRSGTWDVTYQISGDESGPIIGTFSIYGNGKYDVSEQYLSTASSNTPINVKVLSVERVS
jgi:hypothetical protein